MSLDRGARFYASLNDSVWTIFEYYIPDEPGINEKVFIRCFKYSPNEIPFHTQVAVPAGPSPVLSERFKNYEPPDIPLLKRVFLNAIAEGIRYGRKHGDVILPKSYVGSFYPGEDHVCEILGMEKHIIHTTVFSMCVERGIIDVSSGITPKRVLTFSDQLKEELWSTGVRTEYHCGDTPGRYEDDTRMRNTVYLVDFLKRKGWYDAGRQLDEVRDTLAIILKAVKPRYNDMSSADKMTLMLTLGLDRYNEVSPDD